MKQPKSDQQRQEDAEAKLCQALAVLKTPEEFGLFLDDLCTPAERQALADRWLVVEPLVRGTPYRKIHEETGVSITTIGRIARVLMQKDSAYEMVLDRLQFPDSVSETKK
jgi:TrpR-related protein YerC/YecD